MDTNVLPRPTTSARPLFGKVAIVTGSTSGIGLGIARGLAAAGANVVLNGFGKQNEIEDTITDLKRSYGVQGYYYGADMSDPISIEEMVNATLERAKRIDIVI